MWQGDMFKNVLGDVHSFDKAWGPALGPGTAGPRPVVVGGADTMRTSASRRTGRRTGPVRAVGWGAAAAKVGRREPVKPQNGRPT